MKNSKKKTHGDVSLADALLTVLCRQKPSKRAMVLCLRGKRPQKLCEMEIGRFRACQWQIALLTTIMMEQALRILNELHKKKIVEEYAIGGGIAVLFYIEPVFTYDLDIFCLLPSKGGLITLSAIYEFLKDKGYKVHKEQVIIESVPVQFIPAYNSLVEDAVREAKKVSYKSVKTKVLRVEHLLAIMLQTGRPKDRERMCLVLDEAEIDKSYLNEILRKHDLKNKWREFMERHDGKTK